MSNSSRDRVHTQPPGVLYKYFPPDRLDVLQNGLVRFSQIASFNDPLESSPSWGVPPDQGPQQDAVDNFLRVAHRGDPVRPEDVLRAHGFSFANVVGTLSLSEDPLSLLMWAHYAQQHEGFVIGLDTSHEFFKSQFEETLRLDELRPVQYQQARPVPVDTVALAMDEDAAFVKSPEWAYEKEWRIRKHKESARTILAPDATFPIWLMHLPPNCVLDVVLGCRTRQPFRRTLKKILRSDGEYSHVNLYQAWPHPTEYSLRLLPLSLETIELPKKRIVVTDVPEDRVPEMIEHCTRMATLHVEKVRQPERGLWTIAATAIRE